MMQTLHIDEIDKKIIDIIQKDPIATHTIIAKSVKRSQPSVTMRIRKLEDLGIIKHQVGLDHNNLELYFARVDLQTNFPEEFLKEISENLHIVHAYRVNGLNNFSLIIAGFDYEDLDKIVNCHFRHNPLIKNVIMEMVSDIVSDFVLPIRLYNNDCECLKRKPK